MAPPCISVKGSEFLAQEHAEWPGSPEGSAGGGVQGTLQTKPAGTRQDGRRNSALIKRGQMWLLAKYL